MNTRKAFFAVGLLLAFVIILPVARASELDQATKITFNQPVQIPGRVLPAGTYWFVLLDASVSKDIVQVFNSNQSMLYATVFTNSIESPTITDNTAVTFAERESTQSVTLLSWIYPGRDTGHQFRYSNKEMEELAQVKHETITAKTQNKRQAAVSGD
jgi:hypothetical protein